jgi:hypothetical protein
MHTHVELIDYTVYCITLAGEALTLSLVRASRMDRDWKSLRNFLFAHLLMGIVLVPAARILDSVAYLHVFIFVTVCDYLLQLRLIAAILDRRAGRSAKRRALMKAVALAACAIIAIAMSHPLRPLINQEWAALLEIDRTLSYCRCFLLGAVAIFSAFSTSPWNVRELRVYLGIALYGISQLFFLQTQLGTSFAGFDVAKHIPTAVYWISLSLWGSAALSPRSAPFVAANELQAIKTVLHSAATQLESYAGAAKE